MSLNAQEISPAKLSGRSRLQTLGEIAVYDPRLAYTLSQAVMTPKTSFKGGCSYPDWGGMEFINLHARWQSGTANQQIEAKLIGQIETDLWIRDITYTVRRPNAFAGSLFKSQSDFYNSKNPNIDFTLIVKSYIDYTISPDPTPLENLPVSFDCLCPAGMILRCSATFDSFFTNLRALATDEVPMEAIVTFHGIRLPPGMYGSCDYSDIINALKAQGILP